MNISIGSQTGERAPRGVESLWKDSQGKPQTVGKSASMAAGTQTQQDECKNTPLA